MTIIAAAGGRILPLLFNHQLRVIFMVSLLVVFGIKMLHEAAFYSGDSEEPGMDALDLFPLTKLLPESKPT